MGTPTSRFQIHRLLGKGGIGEAFLATETATGLQGVLKKVPAGAFAKKIDSLKKEFATLHRLAHPNIARVFEFGSDAGAAFFFEEFVDGGNIFQAAQGADYNQILSCTAQILRALHYLHSQGFVHGDLKPENILVVRGAPLFRDDAVKLIDFGLARHLSDIAPAAKPSGTIHFMAPELLTGKGCDARADLFALGACLYRMLTGRYPFEEERGNLGRLIDAQLKRTPPEPREFRADLSRGLNDLTMKLMSKAPEGRYPDAQATLDALNTAEGERFALWTLSELKVALHEGGFIGRERELSKLLEAFESGRRAFVLAGTEGAGKSRLAREFVTRLQLEGRETEELDVVESPESSADAVIVPPWTEDETARFLRDRLRMSDLPEALLAASRIAEGIPLRLIALVDFWIADGVIRIEQGRCALDVSKLQEHRDFAAVMDQRLKTLEARKKEILFLCAFSREALSPHLLGRILGGGGGRDTAAVLETLEKEGWLVRQLDHGGDAYRIEGARREELLKSLGTADSFEGLLSLVRETYLSGEHRRARLHLEELLSKFGESPDRADRRRLLYETASLVFLDTGDLDRASDFSRKLLDLPDATDLERGKGFNRLGWIAYRRGQYDDARESFEKAAMAWEKAGDAKGKASAANFLGMIHQARKNLPEALASYRRALSHLPEGDEWIPMMRMNAALCAQEMQDYEAALSSYEQALKESEGGRDKLLRAAILSNLSHLYLYLGRLDRAGSLAHESLKFALENGLESLEGQNYLFLAHLADKEGNVADFRAYVEKARAVYERSGSAAERARAELYGAFCSLTENDLPGCRKAIAALRAGFPDEPEIMAQCDVIEGKLALRSEPPDASLGDPPLERARAYYEGRRDEANLWEIFNALGQLHRFDKPEEARRYFERTLEIIDRLSQKIPESCREAFYRDRKREKILQTLNQLNLNSITPRGGSHHVERRTH